MQFINTKPKFYYWLFLVGAVITEVIGTLAMRYSIQNAPWLGLLVMYSTLLLSYSFLAIAIQRISLAVAYGAWESLGVILITFFSFLLFSEPLTKIKLSGIFLILAGIFLIDYGTVTVKKN